MDVIFQEIVVVTVGIFYCLLFFSNFRRWFYNIPILRSRIEKLKIEIERLKLQNNPEYRKNTFPYSEQLVGARKVARVRRVGTVRDRARKIFDK